MGRRRASRLRRTILSSILLPAVAAPGIMPAPRPAAAQAAGASAATGPRRTAWPPASETPASIPPTVRAALPASFPASSHRRPVQVGRSPRSPTILALGGVLGGAAGFFGGGLLGAWIADETADPGQELAAVGGFAVGGITGEVLGVALGVHRADRGRGSFWSDLFASALSGAGIVGTAALIDLDGAPAWTLAGLGVAVQIGFTVGTEIRSRP